MLYTNNIRWTFGTVDMGGFERTAPLMAGVVMEYVSLPGRVELSARRIESGDHESALGLELGMRARSFVDECR